MNLTEKDVLLVDKPAGMSSFGVVARVRRVLTEQRREQTPELKRAKVGHAGTLDPFATGLLICLLGKATKKAGEFLKLDKRYTATICLGAVSSTGDIEGEIVEYTDVAKRVGSIARGVSGSCRSRVPTRGSLPSLDPLVPPLTPPLDSPSLITDSPKPPEGYIPSISQVQQVLEQFTGEIVQKVPAYSAVKIDGRRAYDLARKGIDVEMPERKVQIYELKLVKYEWPELMIDCKVSSGTYIRALGEDIGKALGVGGYLTALRRTEIGKYKVEDAVSLAELGIDN